ncbi:cytochrome-c oxidase, cbb3-type subunit III [Xanthobacter sp. KR7-225]|uniref:cytochrome-c oxidase, cbb3-type subunit III n=1 Tax=Xanthobacter sp. KR7-225 TaxID=3156613 RepID=UPI0032B40D46
MSTTHDHHGSVDPATGISTTGHEWDGISELNNPLPRWWLWVWYATIVWSIGYWLLFPAWPLISGATPGLLGWNSRNSVAMQIADLNALRAESAAKLANASLEQIEQTPALLNLARAQGRVAFADNCAPCHGAGGGGTTGYPNLNDDDWLWGGSLPQIQQTIEHGIRSGDPDAHQGNMPAFGRDGILQKPEISAVANYVRVLAGLQQPGADQAKGKEVFEANCAACHGEDGKGNQELGAPNLTDGIWLYGSDKATIEAGIINGRGNVMPAWHARLDSTTIKALTVYVHSLGGGR